MSIVKSFSVGNGDMFYINHNSDNFTIIDCYLSDENRDDILNELKIESNSKGITRFISTHPDEDHIQQLDYLDDKMPIYNFYCIKNETTKKDETDGFKRYCELKESKKAYYVSKGCSRKWMNISNDERGCAGINFEWPKTANSDYQDALEKAKNGESPNNISPIFTYGVEDGANFIWMGDLENSFIKLIKDEITPPDVNILFAPHHGRISGKVPKQWLESMSPDIIVMGEAPSENLDYAAYENYNKITQNSAGDIVFECVGSEVNVFVSNSGYSVNFLKNKRKANNHGGYYLGTLDV